MLGKQHMGFISQSELTPYGFRERERESHDKVTLICFDLRFDAEAGAKVCTTHTKAQRLLEINFFFFAFSIQFRAHFLFI